MKKKAMVAMSGGVDSSVAAYLVKSQGYEVVGITLKLFHNEDVGIEKSKTCCSLDDISDARNVAFNLDIPYYVFNFTENFNETVIDKFVKTYKSGGTPNPCIDCNRYVKFLKLLERAEATGFDYVVTGHYAKIEYDKESGRFLLKKALDSTKDQTYVLYSLTQDQLSKTLFPLGNLSKTEVREIADSLGFVNANKADSQDICFVKDNDYAKFIEEYTKSKSIPGDFIDLNGNVLGKHKGIIHYTIGQRKGLGLSLKKPMYVVDKNLSDNTVILGYEDDLYTKSLIASDINLITCDMIKSPMKVKAKTRYTQKEDFAYIEQIDKDKIHVEFVSPQRAITKGQAVVFYDDDVVVGGGTIE